MNIFSCGIFSFIISFIAFDIAITASALEYFKDVNRFFAKGKSTLL